jgi:hypothetical protein
MEMYIPKTLKLSLIILWDEYFFLKKRDFEEKFVLGCNSLAFRPRRRVVQPQPSPPTNPRGQSDQTLLSRQRVLSAGSIFIIWSPSSHP